MPLWVFWWPLWICVIFDTCTSTVQGTGLFAQRDQSAFYCTLEIFVLRVHRTLTYDEQPCAALVCRFKCADVQDSADVIPQYLSQHISLRTSARNTRSSSVPLLCVPFRWTSFARRSFSTATPLIWNSLPLAVLNCDPFSAFKSRLKTHLFSTAFC